MSESFPCGVLTAANSAAFEDLLVLLCSVGRFSGCPVAVIDLGLQPRQAEHLVDSGVRLLPGWVDDWRAACGEPDCHKWVKARLFGSTPFRTTIWLDADAVVVKPLDDLFLAARSGFFALRDGFAGRDDVCNLPGLHPGTADEVPCNSGVVGYETERDAHILAAWAERLATVLADPAVRELVKLYDQGLLIWALHDLGLSGLVLDRPAWNWPARRDAHDDRPTRGWPGDNWGGDLVDQIARTHPEATVVHFAGRPKLADLRRVNHPRTIAGTFTGRHRWGHTERVFVVGLERCGTHAVAAAASEAATTTSWIRHEPDPTLAMEAGLRQLNGNWETQEWHGHFGKLVHAIMISRVSSPGRGACIDRTRAVRLIPVRDAESGRPFATTCCANDAACSRR